jgi:methionyl aminopeptidase
MSGTGLGYRGALPAHARPEAGIVLRSAREIACLREAGRVVAAVLDALAAAVAPGVTTAELDGLAERLIRQAGGVPTFKGYRGFPASICVSVNDEVVHGIPGRRRLQPGDIVSCDVGVTLGGYIGDGARTFALEPVRPEVRRLLEVTEAALEAGIAAARPGARVGDISHAVQTVVEAAGFSVVRKYCGHGVGTSMHEEPQVPNYGSPGRGARLRPGMVLAIEPMVNAGGHDVRVDPNGWTVRTVDGSWSAHFEHTVAITEDGAMVLTAP